MMVKNVVLAGAALVVLVGGAAELWMALRDKRQLSSGQDEALQQVREAVQPGRFLTWTGAAALAVFIPILSLGSHVLVGDVSLVIIALGLAAERAGYLLAIRPADTSNKQGAVRLAISTGIVTVGGLAVGFTA